MDTIFRTIQCLPSTSLFFYGLYLYVHTDDLCTLIIYQVYKVLYSSFVELRLCIYERVYMHVRVKLTPKGSVNIFSCKYLNMIQFLSFKIVKWLEGCKTLLHNARDNFR